MKIGVIIQARTGSTRYPRKIYEDINGKMSLCRVLEGVTSAKTPHNIILAMPKYDEVEFTMKYCDGEFKSATDNRLKLYFGSPENLLERYFFAARENCIDLIARVTGDCPLIQGVIIDEMFTQYMRNGCNGYMANNFLISSAPYPDGVDVEIFPYWMLAETYRLATSNYDKEHVSPFMYSGARGYEISQFLNLKPNTMISYKHKHISFDTKKDYNLICKIAKIYDGCGDINKAINAVEK